MRFLHTADWHVGKTLKGHSRLEEQEQVLREIVRVVREQELDAVLDQHRHHVAPAARLVELPTGAEGDLRRRIQDQTVRIVVSIAHV